MSGMEKLIMKAELILMSGNSVSDDYSMSFDGVEMIMLTLVLFTNYNLNNSSTSISVMLKAFVSGFGYQGSESYIFGTPMFAGNNDRGFRIGSKLANNPFDPPLPVEILT